MNEFNNQLAAALGISPEEQSVLDAGSNHSYRCRCDTCKAWWVAMGPDGGEAGNYGPFEENEIKEACIAAGLKWPECHAVGDEP